VNGSTVTRHCPGGITLGGGTNICNEPTTSVLFDDGIPALAGLDGNMWAGGLLTLQRKGNPQVQLSFSFAEEDYVRVGGVEVVVFNCPEWEVAVQSIGVTGAMATSGCSSLLNVVQPTTTSCDSLVRVCIQLRTSSPVLTLHFFYPADARWVHLAEVTFYNTSSPCSSTIAPTTDQDVTAITTVIAPVTTLHSNGMIRYTVVKTA
jgi:hypothetical protein